MRWALVLLAGASACGEASPRQARVQHPTELQSVSADEVRQRVVDHVAGVWSPFVEPITVREGTFVLVHAGHRYEGTFAAESPTMGALMRGQGDRCSVSTTYCGVEGAYHLLWSIDCWSERAGSDRFFARRADDETGPYPHGTLALMTPPDPVWERPPCEIDVSGEGEVALAPAPSRVAPLLALFEEQHGEDLAHAITLGSGGDGLRGLDIVSSGVSDGVWTAMVRVRWSTSVSIDEGERPRWRQATTTYDTTIRVGPASSALTVDVPDLVSVERFACTWHPTRRSIPMWPAPPFDASTGEGCRLETTDQPSRLPSTSM